MRWDSINIYEPNHLSRQLEEVPVFCYNTKNNTKKRCCSSILFLNLIDIFNATCR